MIIPNNDPVMPELDDPDNVNLVSTEHMAQDEMEVNPYEDEGYLYLLDEALVRQRVANNNWGVRRNTPIFYSDEEEGVNPRNGGTENREDYDNDFPEFDDNFSL